MRDWIMEPSAVNKRVAEVLWRSRQHCGLSLRDVAERLRVSHPTVRSWEQGDAPLTVAVLAQLAQVYGCMAVDFFDQFGCPAAGAMALGRRAEYERHYAALQARRAGGPDA